MKGLYMGEVIEFPNRAKVDSNDSLSEIIVSTEDAPCIARWSAILSSVMGTCVNELGTLFVYDFIARYGDILVDDTKPIIPPSELLTEEEEQWIDSLYDNYTKSCD
jgi:hypothetical protein